MVRKPMMTAGVAALVAIAIGGVSFASASDEGGGRTTVAIGNSIRRRRPAFRPYSLAIDPARTANGYLWGMSDEPSRSSESPADSETGDKLAATPSEQERPQGMLPGRQRRRSVIERGFMRIVATGGIIGIATVLGAVLTSQDVAGWIVGLAVGLTSVILAALLWSSRQL